MRPKTGLVPHSPNMSSNRVARCQRCETVLVSFLPLLNLVEVTLYDAVTVGTSLDGLHRGRAASRVRRSETITM